MHLASPAATVWCSCPPSVCLYPTFISLSVLPSIHLFNSSGGELWGSLSALHFHRWSGVKENHMAPLNRILGAVCYLFPVCARETYSLQSSLKFLRSAIRCRCSTLMSDEGRGTLGRSCDKTPSSPLHVHSFLFKFSLLTSSLHWCIVAVWMKMKHCKMKSSFSSWSWTLKSVSGFCFITILFAMSSSHAE